VLRTLRETANMTPSFGAHDGIDYEEKARQIKGDSK